ncbi:MAG: glycosyltransferase family 2 protein [Selenomonadaceae bacterium]|nr:glycosyltransferase family 2 protein [Selenomonadaceae bacterium]MBR1858860.1 glycosyltransferase family 2 protein [Selenomonadaceae bacterium]
MKQNVTPAVSIIVPMYNTEKYIKQCLESVAAQTMQDFEVIVVDDCSTDNSVAIVESLKKNFDGRLTLIKMKKNNGAPGIPRNTAIKSANGKYISFLDSDDMLTLTALSELYEIAEQTCADVLHAEQFYIAADNGEEFNDDTPLGLRSWENGQHTKKVQIETQELNKRLQLFCQRRFNWSSCNKFFKREFLIKNKIEFPRMPYSEDLPFCFKSLCLAKNYVRIPNVFYKCRYRQGSLQHRSISAEQIIKIYLNVLIEGTQILDKFMGELKFFEDIENHVLKYTVIDFFIREHLEYFEEIYKKYPVPLIDILVRETLNPVFGKNSALISYLFNSTNKTQHS